MLMAFLLLHNPSCFYVVVGTLWPLYGGGGGGEGGLSTRMKAKNNIEIIQAHEHTLFIPDL